MKAILRGVAELNFTSQNGNHVEGTNLYISFLDKNVNGEKCERVFAPIEINFPDNIKIGDPINLFFNHKGKLESITK